MLPSPPGGISRELVAAEQPQPDRTWLICRGSSPSFSITKSWAISVPSTTVPNSKTVSGRIALGPAAAGATYIAPENNKRWRVITDTKNRFMDSPVSRSLSLCSFTGTRRQLYRAGSTSAGTPWPRAGKARCISFPEMKLQTMTREGTPLGLLNLPTYHRREAKESNCRFPRVTKVYGVINFSAFPLESSSSRQQIFLEYFKAEEYHTS